jgi:putative ABC transport system ATP-binding protein
LIIDDIYHGKIVNMTIIKTPPDNKKKSVPLISLDDVKLDLESGAGKVNILKGINLRIHEGDSVSIVGPSGAGKTSLMMVVAGIEAVSSGKINVSNHDLSSLTEDQLARFRRDNVGIVFQAFRLIPNMTALENVALPLEMAGNKNAFSDARKGLELVKLLDRATHYPDQLSGGEQQRIAIARAFVKKPKILLADEPTGNLDERTGETTIDLLFDLQASYGTTLLLITHDHQLAKKCDRTLSMLDGLLLEE